MSTEELYKQLEQKRLELESIETERKRIADERLRLLHRKQCTSMNKQWYGSPVGDAAGKQRAANLRANDRMRKQDQEVDVELKIVSKKLLDISRRQAALQEELRRLNTLFSGAVTIENARTEIAKSERD